MLVINVLHFQLTTTPILRFVSLAKIGNYCTSIAFANALHPDRDVLVSCSFCFFYILQSSTGKVVAKLAGHRTPITHISVDKKCYVAVTSSTRQTIVWDLQCLTLLHKIVLDLDIDLVKVNICIGLLV